METGLARNQEIADRLREMADLLDRQGANPFRVSAYRRAARTLVELPKDVGGLAGEEGIEGLEKIPHVGAGIAGAIWEILRTGRWGRLERLRGTLDPVKIFQSVPGIGEGTARRIHDELHIDSLEALETAGYDGRLETVAGLGPRKAAAIRASVGAMLGRVRGQPPPSAAGGFPDTATLLDVDREYREKAEAGLLPTIAPKRLNPGGTAWLPVLHARRGRWNFTAIYSNSERANQLGKTRDWVVIYFYDGDHREGQRTAVTEIRGPFTGARVIRGMEEKAGRR